MPKPDNTEELREKLRALPRTKNTDPRYPIDAYEDDLVQLILADREAAVREARDDELEKMSDHWFDCDGSNCEFGYGTDICGYYEHRKAELKSNQPKEEV